MVLSFGWAFDFRKLERMEQSEARGVLLLFFGGGQIWANYNCGEVLIHTFFYYTKLSTNIHLLFFIGS